MPNKNPQKGSEVIYGNFSRGLCCAHSEQLGRNLAKFTTFSTLKIQENVWAFICAGHPWCKNDTLRTYKGLN